MINADEARTQQLAAIAAKEAELKSDADKVFKDCIEYIKKHFLGETSIEQRIKWAAEDRVNTTTTEGISQDICRYINGCKATTKDIWFLDKIKSLHEEIDKISEEAKATLEKNGFTVSFLDRKCQYGGEKTVDISYHNKLEIKW